MSRLKRNKNKKQKKRLYIISTVVSFFIILAIVFALDLIPNISKNTDSNNTLNDTEGVVEAQSTSSQKTVNLDGYLFLGDSYTVLLQETIKEHNPNAIIKAVTGVQPEYWIEHFDELPDNEDVEGVVLLIGVNGAAYSDNIPNKKKLISDLVEKYTDKTIYVQEVFPVGENFTNANPVSFNEAITNNNKESKKYCDNYDNVYYINATDGLVTEDGYLKFTKDGLHIASDKQEKFYNNIVSAVYKEK